MKILHSRFYMLAAGIVLLGCSSTAMAAAIGTASLGQCSGGGVMVNSTTINWQNAGTQPNTGCFNTGIPTSISYSGGSVGAGATGNIKDLVAPAGTVDQFMTISGTNLDFVFNGFAAPPTSNTACDSTLGDSCIVATGSPFFLTNTATGVSVNLDAFGTITDGGVTSNWTVIFSTQLPSTTAAAIQSTIEAGGTISSTYAGALTISSVPEPTTLSMLLLGGVALLGSRFRRRKTML